MNRNLSPYYALVLLLMSKYALATDTQIRGTLLAPPDCVIEEGEVIDINFGENLGVNKINGINYTQQIPFSVVCSGDNSGWSFTLSLNSNPPLMDSFTLQTTMPGLGIRIMKDGYPLLLNRPWNADLNNLPVLQAVPVKADSVDLTEGDFSANATLLAQYQ